MKQQIIVFKTLNGQCGIIYPQWEENPTISIEEHVMRGVIGFDELVKKGEAPKEAYDRIGEKALQAITPFRITTIDKIPKDRYFRNAWTDDNATTTVDIHLGKARAVHMNEIRKVRNDKFIELGFPTKLNEDLEMAIIPEAIRNKLRALRDLPETIDLSQATTPKELKAIWPKELSEYRGK